MEENDDLFASRRKRDRSREGAGKSERSHIKHDIARKAVGAQIAAFRIRNNGRILLIDGNAGDGYGVERPQADLFGENPSCATAEMLVELAERDGNADVVLCEADKEKRSELAVRFPQAVIVGDHANAPHVADSRYVYALWLSDPCGPSAHGVPHMRLLADRIRSDFVVIFNEGWIITRLAGTVSDKWKEARERYLPMVCPEWWTDALDRRHLARTSKIINGATNFKYRVLVISNFLSDGVKRKPMFEVVK
jgi:hypothetical protein